MRTYRTWAKEIIRLANTLLLRHGLPIQPPICIEHSPGILIRVQESGRELPGCHHSGRHAGDADDIPVARPKWLFTRARGGYIDGKEED